MGNMKACCGNSPTEGRRGMNSATTFSTEIQRFSNALSNEPSESEFVVIKDPSIRQQNSINLRSTRKLSQECGNRLNLTNDDIHQHYSFGDAIGHGKYGTVYKGSSVREPTFEVAIKVIKIRKIKSKFESVMKEIEMLKGANHPDIVQIIGMYQNPKKLYIVMEYVGGEELFDFIVNNEKIIEINARTIIEQLLHVISYLNSVSMCHRDLKPENIMINPETLKIKLLDFGLSTRFNESQDLTSPVGTPYYVAPEILRGKYNRECDMWSVGIICFILLTGVPPFQGDDLADIYKEILQFNLVFEEEWDTISQEAKDFVSKLIEPSVDIRLNPEQALAHEWIKNIIPKDNLSKVGLQS